MHKFNVSDIPGRFFVGILLMVNGEWMGSAAGLN
jgi:hypothetical protein